MGCALVEEFGRENCIIAYNNEKPSCSNVQENAPMSHRGSKRINEKNGDLTNEQHSMHSGEIMINLADFKGFETQEAKKRKIYHDFP